MLSAGSGAQAKPRREKFPPRSWKAIERPEQKDRQGSIATGGTSRSGEFATGVTVDVRIDQEVLPCDEVVITRGDGVVLARRPVGESLELPPLQVGDEYVVYAAQTKERRYERIPHARTLVELPGRTFPQEGWEPMKPSRLKLKGVQQNSWAARAAEALEKNIEELLKNRGRKPKNKKRKKEKKDEHTLQFLRQISFDARKVNEPVLYLLCRVRPDGSDEIMHQALSSPLRMDEIQKGESVRIYELYLRRQRFRESEVIQATVGRQ